MRPLTPTDAVNEVLACPCCGALLIVAVSVSARDPRPVDWTQIDWTKPNKVIAKKIGRSAALVARSRVKLGKTNEKPKWESIDWSLPSSEIMRLTNSGSTTVNRMRHAFAPQTLGKINIGAPIGNTRAKRRP